jgi:ABC-type Na+ efflux pump permease subunit
MMRAKSRLFAVLVLALTIGIVSLVSTAAGKKGHGKRVQIINLTTQTVQEADLDLGATGPSVGDRFVFSDDVSRGSKHVGILGGECTVTRLEPVPVPAGQEPTSAIVNCVVTVQLSKGQLTLQGLVNFSEQAGSSFTVAITGGTGAYRTAHGEATVTESEEENGPEGLRLKLIR